MHNIIEIATDMIGPEIFNETDGVFKAGMWANQYTNSGSVSKEQYESWIEKLVGIRPVTEFQKQAEVTFRYLVREIAVRARDKIELNPEDMIKAVEDKTNKFMLDFPWYKPGYRSALGDAFDFQMKPEPVTFVGVTSEDIKVTGKKGEGNLKKGAKSAGAEQIFLQNRDKSRKEVIEMFMQQLDMSRAGAQTYFYNMSKKYPAQS